MFTKLQANIGQFRETINSVMDKDAGVWTTNLNSSQKRASVAIFGFMLLAIIGILALPEAHEGEHNHVLTMMLILLGSFTPGLLIATVYSRTVTPNPSTSFFLVWSVLTATLGIGLGIKLKSWLTTFLIVPSDDTIAWAPYMGPAMFILMSGYRLLQHNAWQQQVQDEQLRRQIAEQGLALAEAQLKMLQAQIEPHFLFNTLASVATLVRKDPGRAERLVRELSIYLREAIPDVRGVGSTLGREIGLIEAYLKIIQIRMGDRLTFSIDLPPSLNEQPFLPLVLHTLVENAIKHGIEPTERGGHISILTIRVDDEYGEGIRVTVQDNGVGFGTVHSTGTGVGLSNIRSRLEGLFGEAGRLTVTELASGGVTASVRIPKYVAIHDISNN